MSKDILNNQEQTELRSNEAVESCTDRYIIYTSTFKVKAVEQYHQGMSAYQIFTKEGLRPPLVKRSKMKESIRRWKRTMDTQGVEALKKRTHRQTKKKKLHFMTDKEKIKHLELQNELLRAEKDFLVRRRAALGLD